MRGVRRLARLVEEREQVLVPSGTPSASPLFVAYGPSAAQLAFVHADATIESGRTGAGVLFGILDTKFDFSHPAMSHIPAAGPPARAAGLHRRHAERLPRPGDELDRAGLPGRAARRAGLRRDVLAGTTEFAPTETHAEEDAFVAGLEWMERQGVDVVSVSLGYSTFDAARATTRTPT